LKKQFFIKSNCFLCSCFHTNNRDEDFR
jgi:hypothetical protein